MRVIQILCLPLILMFACESKPCEGPSCPVCTHGDKRACYTYKGKGADQPVQLPCKRGEQICGSSGKWEACKGEKHPTTEVCGDKKDNDCDGQTDEGCECKPGESRTCGFNAGICKQGKQTCDAKGKWRDCIGIKTPEKEKCEGKKDENCDGFIDEGCVCILGQTRDCGSQKGECQPGKQSCNEQGKWEACKGEKQPTKEICDGKDNDCDGNIDEGLTCP